MIFVLKRATYLSVSILLILMSSALLKIDEELIRVSEETVEKYGGLYTDGDGNIISIYAYHGRERFLENLSEVTKLGESSDIPVFVAIPPRKMDVFELPDDIDTAPHKALFALAERECEKAEISYIDLLDTMEGEYIYFATDHHWTSKGAYLAYTSIINALGKEPVAENEFEIKTVYTKYRGSDYNKSDKSSDRYDELKLYYSSDYSDYETVVVSYPYDSDENNEAIGGMYCLEALNSWDPYTVYFKGNTPYITIRNGNDRETLLIVRDSFASALAPFLALHYDIVMIDPRYCPERLSEIAERESADLILVLENMGSFTENTVKLQY